MLDGIYAKGRLTKTQCTKAGLSTFLTVSRKAGYTLYFINDPIEGLIIPFQCDHMAAIEKGQTVVLNSKKNANIIIARKLTEEEQKENMEKGFTALTHVYDIVSVCESKERSKANYISGALATSD